MSLNSQIDAWFYDTLITPILGVIVDALNTYFVISPLKSWLFEISFLLLAVSFGVLRFSFAFGREQNLLFSVYRLISRGLSLSAFLPVFLFAATMGVLYKWHYQAFAQVLEMQGYTTWEAIQSDLILYTVFLVVFVLVFHVFCIAKLEPAISQKVIKHSGKCRSDNAFSDVRELALPKATPFNPERYFNTALKTKSVFFGLNEKGKPVFIPRSIWEKTNIQIMGAMGAGKGVQAQVTLSQSLLRHDCVITFDPKGDDWLPHVLKRFSEKADKPFLYVDLRAKEPQINPFQGATGEEISELLIASLDLEESGDNSDVYAIAAQDAAQKLATLAASEGVALSELHEKLPEVLTDQELKMVSKFKNKLSVISQLTAIQTRYGADIASIMRSGGCVYIVGDDVANKKDVQKMLLIRVLQLVKNIPTTERQFVSIFADEVKSLLCQTFVDQLGQLRSRRANVLYAHQSFADLDRLNRSTQQILLDNASLRWFYKQQDFQMATKVAQYTGQRIAQTSVHEMERNEAAKDVVSNQGRRSVETQAFLIDTNTIQNLPDSTAILIGNGLAQMAFCSPPRVQKSHFSCVVADPLIREDATDSLASIVNSSPKPDTQEKSEVKDFGAYL